MQQPLSVLIVEDREHDAALLVRELRRAGYELFHERVENEPAMIDALGQRPWDIIFVDYSLPQFNANAALAIMARSGLDIPIVVVSGCVGEEAAAEVMRAGAHDLILKNNLKRLPPVVARELEVARTRRENKAADAKLDHERELLRQLMQGIPDAICFKDRERRYIRLNHVERSNLNIADDVEVVGEASDKFIAPELARTRRAEEEQVLATGAPLVDCIEKVTAADGTMRWLSATKAPIRRHDGEIVGIVEIARDITESKRQEQLKNEFIATVSHELRTPLTSIMGSIGCLAGGTAGALPNPAMRLLQLALGNCRRLIGIVNDILDIERIESGNMLYAHKPVEVCELIDQVIEANRGIAAQNGVCLRFADRAAQATVYADPDRLMQVVTNLLSNAIKFSPSDAEVLFSVERSEKLVRISVRDHGPGIPADYKDRIFEKFVQVDATDQRQRGGTGLGLSIAKEIVSRLEGKIGVESAPGGGSIFKLELPEFDPNASHPREAA